MNSKLWKDEFYDVLKVFQHGVDRGYAAENWTLVDGKSISHKENCDHMFHHLARLTSGDLIDDDSKLHHSLHLACRALMMHWRFENGVIHDKDKV